MTKFWAVIPAAGVGRRMGHSIPKQYLPLQGRCVIEHALDTLVSHPRIQGAIVALGADDQYWQDMAFADHPRVETVVGGAERVESVRNALDALADSAAGTDWVLVHDAARPCLRGCDIDRLIGLSETSDVGGVLGVPVRDTMKRTDTLGQVGETVDRSQLWHAFTPQMFQLGTLRQAITSSLSAGLLVTDEASAIEYLGLKPTMVEGRRDNIKVTEPLDLPLADFILRQQS